MYPFPAGTYCDLKLDASGPLIISAKVVTCDPQFGNGIVFVRMLPEDRATLIKFLDQVAPGSGEQNVAGREDRT
jgi:hypothetical protein